ncbi:hypothetical protein IKQ19_14910, partial [Candidatus Saccharibacteria bacterium]|nr:hypothetical protein [Candidatus Saccharibacteria bacterium]
KWFETQDQIGYYKEFAQPKIMYPNMTSAFPFTYDETGSFGNDKSFIITLRHFGRNEESGEYLLKALLAIFNSNLVKLWIWYNCPELMGGTREIRKAYFENLRIPLDNPELLQQLATLADEIITAKKRASCHPERTLEPKAIGEVEGSSEVSDEAIQRNIATLETQVNTLVYQLYGITDTEEIEAVEKR